MLWPLLREQIGAQQQATVGQRLRGRVLQNDLPGPLARHRENGGGNIRLAEFHFHLKLLFHQLIAEPVGQLRARLSGAGVFEFRGNEHFAEMSRDAREAFLPAFVGTKRQTIRTAEITSDDLRLGLE